MHANIPTPTRYRRTRRTARPHLGSNRNVHRGRSHRSAVFGSTTACRACPKGTGAVKDKRDHHSRVAAPSVKSVPEPQPLPSCMPRPKRKAPIATCAPRPSKTGICQPDVPVRSAKKSKAPPPIRKTVGWRGGAADGVEVIRTLLLHRLSDDLCPNCIDFRCLLVQRRTAVDTENRIRIPVSKCCRFVGIRRHI